MIILTLLWKYRKELAVLCPNMVPNTEKLMEVFIGGLPQSIKGNVTASKPQTLEEAITITQRLMEQIIKHNSAQETNDHKRKFEDRRNITDNNNYPNNRNKNNHSNNHNNDNYQNNHNNHNRNNDYHQQQNRRQETIRTYAATPTENKRSTENKRTSISKPTLHHSTKSRDEISCMHTRSQTRNLYNQQQHAPPAVVEPFNLEDPFENPPPPPPPPMDDQRTMAQLLEAPTEGYVDANCSSLEINC
ncbi:hypothetical protein Tco_1448942 [Tanacetum coccineum]